MKEKIRRSVETLIAGLLVFLLTVSNVLSDLDFIAKDRLYQIPRGIESKIKIIGIDERTLAELGPIQTWSRGRYAELLDVLCSNSEYMPAVIGFDIIFSGNVDEGDEKFSEAAAKYKNVVVVNHLLYDQRLIENENGLLVNKVDGVEKPFESLDNAARSGFSNVAPDSDGVVRRMIPVERYQDEEYKAFSGVVYDAYCEKIGIASKTVPVDKFGYSLINYSGRPGDYEYISMVDVLNGKIDPRAFKDSIVLVGAYAPGMQDSFDVPNGRSQQMYGVEIHANILQSYIDGRFATNGSPVLYGLISALIVMLLSIIIRRLKLWQALILVIAVIGANAYTLMTINEKGHAYSLIYFPLVLLISFIYTVSVRYIVEKAKRKQVLDAFRKYVAPEVVEEISKKGDFKISLGGENRDIAVLFVDIRGFTTMSEALEPEQVVAILNEYLSLTTKSIFDNSGTLDKFVGDATMAVFNSPFDLPDYEFKAVCAAMDIVNGGKALEEKLMEKYGRTVGFGVGVNVGPAVVGNIGCDFRMDFTAIGDTVNTAARLEANAKKGQVLISDVLYERVKDRVEVKEIGEIPLKGKSKGVFVYEVTEVHNA
ncbi:adenylate cyclase [Eubacterium ruminantium]|nr:adenylate cyclase [Eubacterium ruminantium]